NNGVTDYDHGIYHTASYGLIEGNTIYDNMGSGIKVGWGQEAVDNIVRNNLVYDNNRADGVDGQKKQGRGIGVYAGSGTLVYNNIIRGAHHSGIDVTYGGNNAQVFNNTVYNLTGYGIVVGYGSDGTKNAENTTVLNNIVYQQANQPAIYNLRGINTIIEHNLTYGLNPAIGKRADTNAIIQNNLENIDPLFVDPLGGNFSLLPDSPAIDVGVTQNNLSLDFLGQPRPQGSGLDLGAMEQSVAAQPTEPPQTEEPTVAPTLEPTIAPTIAPTLEPTLEPTIAPTVEVTEEPTTEPPVIPVDPPNSPTAMLDVSTSAGIVDVTVNLYNVDGLYGLQASCLVDATVLSGAELVTNSETVFNNDNSVFVDQGDQNGQWVIGVSRLQPAPAFSGNGAAFALRYQRLSAAGSPVNCEILAVDASGITLPVDVVNTVVNPEAPVEPTVAPTQAIEPTEVPPEPTEITPEPTEVTPEPTEEITPAPTEVTPEPTEEITPAPTAVLPEPGMISGSVHYQGREDHSGIQITLLLEGEIMAEAMSDASGLYSLSDVPLGTYTLRLSAPQQLSLTQDITLDGPTLDLGDTTLVAGDVDSNGVIDILDAGLVGANFNLVGPDLPPADINADQRIDIRDLVLVGSNFGAIGAP
ncbi:MAG: right-handed parallel beta-helix repeat-containing protein, partial [Anaerolineae bacterium]|nr:right-handed parallel beta-helix repeat-containing protein [Anaerolineae bacterium]